MTHIHCTECRRRIPYDHPRVYMQFMEGGKVTETKTVCVRWCIEKVEEGSLISSGMRAAAHLMHRLHPGKAKEWGGQRHEVR